MIKTRIKEITHADGTTEYVAQYKGIFCWECFSENSQAYRKTVESSFACVNIDRNSLEFAQKVVENYIQIEYERKQEGKNKKVVKTSFIDYP